MILINETSVLSLDEAFKQVTSIMK